MNSSKLTSKVAFGFPCMKGRAIAIQLPSQLIGSRMNRHQFQFCYKPSRNMGADKPICNDKTRRMFQHQALRYDHIGAGCERGFIGSWYGFGDDKKSKAFLKKTRQL